MGPENKWVCEGWDSSQCVGTPYCPPRCPRFTDRESAAALVQPHQSTDVDALIEMYLDLDPADRTMGLPPATKTELRQWLRRFTDDGWSLIAKLDSTVVGHAGVTPGDAAVPHLVVFVADEAQGRGIGSELIRQLIAHAVDRGHEALMLTVDADNDPAVTVYGNLEFDIIERLGDVLEMQLSLDAPIADRVRRPPAERED